MPSPSRSKERVADEVQHPGMARRKCVVWFYTSGKPITGQRVSGVLLVSHLPSSARASCAGLSVRRSITALIAQTQPTTVTRRGQGRSRLATVMEFDLWQSRLFRARLSRDTRLRRQHKVRQR